MKRKTLYMILLLAFAAILASNAVYAAQPTFWDSLMGPFEGLPRAYARAGYFIDGIIAFIIFYGLISFTLGNVMKTGYGEKKPTALFVGLSLVLSIGLALYESQTGFSLANFGFVALIIIVAFIMFVIYKGLVATEAVHPTTAAAASYAAFFIVISTYGILGEIRERSSPLAGILTLLAFIIFFLLFLKLGGGLTKLITTGKLPEAGEGEGFFKKLFGGKKAPEGGPGPEGEGAPPEAAKAAGKAERRAYGVVKRAERQAMVEHEEIKNAVVDIEAKEKAFTSASAADKVEAANELLEKIKSVVHDLRRKGGREENFAIRARKYSEYLQKKLEEIGEEKAGKIVGEDVNTALGYAVAMEEALKQIEEKLIGGAEGLEADFNKIRGGEGGEAEFAEKIALVIKELKDIEMHMAAIIKLDEDIANIILEEEAKAAEKK